MTHVDDIDRMWRDALASAAELTPEATDPRVRVAGRVRRLRRERATVVTLVAALTIIGGAFGVGAMTNRVSHVRVSAPTPTVVDVTDAPGSALKIEFPGRPFVNNPPLSHVDAPPEISLPAGPVRFVVHAGAMGHVLVIDGVPGFNADFDSSNTTITQDVTLAPGRYLMHCAIPGHEAAGEDALLIVG